MIGNILGGAMGKVVPAMDYESIASSTVGAGGTATILFSNIPQTYQHLQIRGIVRSQNSNTGSQIYFVNLNEDTNSANYAKHCLVGNGSTISTFGSTNDRGFDAIPNATYNTNVFNAHIIDILDYRSTDKQKTMRAISANENNASSGAVGQLYLESNLWRNTSAVTSISLTILGNFTQYSSVALYGIKG